MDEDQRQNNKEKHWLLCPVCKSKTRIKLREDMVMCYAIGSNKALRGTALQT